jgi:LysM repeat protein
MEPTQIKAKPGTSVGARLLAPLALIAVAIVLALVVADSLDQSEGGGGSHRAGNERGHQQNPSGPATYVIQPGDTLETIAAKTGVSVSRLQQLNPDVDPQALTAGASLKLR